MAPDESVLLRLKTPWHDGTSHIALQPLELLEKLAALIPRPYVNLIVYHGVLAPNAKWRREVVDFGRAKVESESSATSRRKDAGSGASSHGDPLTDDRRRRLTSDPAPQEQIRPPQPMKSGPSQNSLSPSG